jgi:hypothetical protein
MKLTDEEYFLIKTATIPTITDILAKATNVVKNPTAKNFLRNRAISSLGRDVAIDNGVASVKHNIAGAKQAINSAADIASNKALEVYNKLPEPIQWGATQLKQPDNLNGFILKTQFVLDALSKLVS